MADLRTSGSVSPTGSLEGLFDGGQISESSHGPHKPLRQTELRQMALTKL
jgi:hypothetical protein